jgi:hypothetical protein
MEKVTSLTLCFLGQRDYLHGTTLFDALEPWYAGGSDIRFKLGRMMRTDRVAVEEASQGALDVAKYAATLHWRTVSGEHRLGVVPLEPLSAPRRLPFDEEAIVGRAQWDGSQVTLIGQRGESFVRSVVALNKALLFRVLTPTLPGQWLFTRLELARPISRFEQLRLTYKSSVGLAAVSTAMEVDGVGVGNVMFSWLKR